MHAWGAPAAEPMDSSTRPTAGRRWANACRFAFPALLTLLVVTLAPSPYAMAQSIVQPVAADPTVIRAQDGRYYM